MRPSTLSSVAERIRQGAPGSSMIAEFLDEFYQARDKLGQAASLHDEPPPTGNTQVDALLAAICEYLTRQHGLPEVPHWVAGPTRFLTEPWFTNAAGDDAMREYLAFTSPAEFRHHNIFTEAQPLRRATQRLDAKAMDAGKD